MSNIQIATETNELISSNGENHNNNNHFDKQICFQHIQHMLCSKFKFKTWTKTKNILN